MTQPPPNQDSLTAIDAGDPAVMAQLRAGCAALKIPLSPHQVAQFELYFRELVTWNDRMNLTAITNYEQVQVKHFLDSIAALPLIAAEWGESVPPAASWPLLDVGTGAGFPGIPLKIVAPRIKLTLMDGTGKKIQFLQQLVAKLGLERVDVVQGRAEEAGRDTAYRGQFDLVTARAVASLNTLVEYLLPLVRRQGMAVIYKGATAAQEFIEARNAIELLGGETVRFAPVQVPFLDEQRFVLLIKKARLTPDLYPRGQGLARKKPLT
jgi:16S rRNA (guanine527-N7)-methyltransferase